MGIFRFFIRILSAPRKPTRDYRIPHTATRAGYTSRYQPSPSPKAETLVRGRCWVVDGDTIIVNDVRIRLAGIDAPELDHPWGRQAKWAMVRLCKGQIITARIRPELSYDRVVAECYLPDGRDLSAELVRMGLALDWAKFSGGKYRHLETDEARKKLWRADARQRGKLWLPR